MFNIPAGPGDAFVPAAARAWHLGLTTKAYLQILRECGVQPIRISGSPQVRSSEHDLVLKHLEQMQLAQANAKKPAASAALPDAVIERLKAQDAALEQLREEIALMRSARGKK